MRYFEVRYLLYCKFSKVVYIVSGGEGEGLCGRVVAVRDARLAERQPALVRPRVRDAYQDAVSRIDLKNPLKP